MKQFEIQSFEAGQRLDRYVEKLLRGASRNFLYKMMRKKNIVLNDKKAAGQELLQAGDVIKIYFSDETFEKFAQEGKKEGSRTSGNSKTVEQKGPMPKIIYEDGDILILNKPSGMLSQKSAPDDFSANDFVIGYLLETGQLTEENLNTFRPSVCNRLDRNTSGLLIAGKSIRGLQEMSAQLRTRDIRKYYLCLVKGRLETEGHLKGYLKKSKENNKVTVQKNKFPGADPIETAWSPLKVMDRATLLKVHLITGRSHQIRAHLSGIGHPILGDYKYGDKGWNQELKAHTGISSQLLHAWEVILPDGRSFRADPPDTFEAAINYMKGSKSK